MLGTRPRGNRLKPCHSIEATLIVAVVEATLVDAVIMMLGARPRGNRLKPCYSIGATLIDAVATVSCGPAHHHDCIHRLLPGVMLNRIDPEAASSDVGLI